jgi:hypothetical protein
LSITESVCSNFFTNLSITGLLGHSLQLNLTWNTLLHGTNHTGLKKPFHTKFSLLSSVHHIVYSCLQNFLLGGITNWS